MAKAEPIFNPAPVKYPDGVFLTLDKNEAFFLLAILQRIGGSSCASRRRYADAMNKALNTAGFVDYDTSDISESSGHGSLYFKEMA